MPQDLTPPKHKNHLLAGIEKRGAKVNPQNRFEAFAYDEDLSDYDRNVDDLTLAKSIKTKILFDDTKSILTKNDSPDIPFTYSVNPYRGCEHGCIYCYARPTHEALGLSSGLDFESTIMVKKNAPELLRDAMRKKAWRPEPICFSGVTDCYQPLEKRFHLTRRCLEVLYAHKNPAMIITKSALVLKDRGLLQRMASENLVQVAFTMTSLSEELSNRLEPRAASPMQRLHAMSELAALGVPVFVMVAPIIPGLTEDEIPMILEAASKAGAGGAGMTVLRLPYAVKEIFDHWLDVNYPLKKERCLALIRDMHEGKLAGAEFGARMRGQGAFATHISQVFKLFSKRSGLERPLPPLDCSRFTPMPEAVPLF